MKVKQLTEKEAILGKTCCFELARGGVLTRCGSKAVAKLGRNYLCGEHLKYACSITKGCEYILEKKQVRSSEFMASI